MGPRSLRGVSGSAQRNYGCGAAHHRGEKRLAQQTLVASMLVHVEAKVSLGRGRVLVV